MSATEHGSYYLPEPSHWPLVGSVGLFCTLFGAAHWLHGVQWGPYLFAAGLFIVVIMMFGWFHRVIHESRSGWYDKQLDHSFRWGMCWFIFSEVMFFSAFFGVLLYVRLWAVPWLGGEDGQDINLFVLWQNFSSTWPLLHTPNPTAFSGPESVMYTWGLPAVNTLLLLTSGVTVTFAHWGLVKGNRKMLIIGLIFTILLGMAFLVCQGCEYFEAYTEKGLKLSAGIFGTTFFMLTGFHGLHVTIGTIMLIVILCRCIAGHFDKDHQFAFEAVSWYWHFVDVVWLLLFIFVYWL